MKATMNNPFDLVALHGLPGVGKDTVADYLVAEHGFRKFGFADALYREVATTFGVKESELRSREWKNNPQNLLSGRCSDCATYRAILENHGVDMDAPQTSRFHLRMWAHEYRNMTDPYYWVNELHQVIASPKLGDIVINDLRYANTEFPHLFRFAQVSKREFSVIEIVSSFNESGGHASDNRLPDHQIHTTVVNVLDQPQIMFESVRRFLGYSNRAVA